MSIKYCYLIFFMLFFCSLKPVSANKRGEHEKCIIYNSVINSEVTGKIIYASEERKPIGHQLSDEMYEFSKSSFSKKEFQEIVSTWPDGEGLCDFKIRRRKIIYFDQKDLESQSIRTVVTSKDNIILFSSFIINKNKDAAVLILYITNGPLEGSKQILLLKKRRGRWIIADRETQWES